MRSVWEADGGTPAGFAPLRGELHTDVLIIGGGLCGLLCAALMQEAGVDYALVEADTLCCGISKNTTAKITVQHGLLYHKLLKTFGLERAGGYLHANTAALERYAALCRGIDCDFSYADSYVYSIDSRERTEKEAAALESLGCPATFCESTSLPFPVAGAVCCKRQAMLHPLKFAAAISRDLHIYEHTRVRELVGTKAITDSGTVFAKQIVVATHFPFLNKHGSYFLKLYQHRSYELALKNAPLPNGMYVDESKKGLSFRNYNGLLLLGGGSHRTGKQGGGWQELRAFAKRYYPKAAECGHWATQDCMSLDGIPYIGAYSASTEGLYVATGFNKWGMTSSMVAAMLLTDLVQGRENPYAWVFSPSRSILHPQLAINAAEALLHWLIPTAKRCPHLGCALRWNPREHTWDCACHGSRFQADGRCIDNPATGDLKL